MSVVIFDMDGVIIDSEGAYLTRLIEFMTYKGYSFKLDDLLSLVGSNSKRDKIKMKEWYGDDFDYDQFEAEKREYYKDRPIDYQKLIMPNIIETLLTLKKQGHRLSLASSSPLKYIYRTLDMLEARDYFDNIISGENFKESKPNPEIYNYARSRYPSVSIEDIYVVEDSTLGITAAKKAGLKVIAKIDTRYNFDQSQADYKVNDLLEIIPIVNKK